MRGWDCEGGHGGRGTRWVDLCAGYRCGVGEEFVVCLHDGGTRWIGGRGGGGGVLGLLPSIGFSIFHVLFRPFDPVTTPSPSYYALPQI